MASGGKRDGAGRKRNIPNKATKERQEKIAKSGATPLEVMIAAMRHHYALASAMLVKGNLGLAAKALDAAGAFAKDAAPYIHPKLANIGHSGEVNGTFKFTFVLDNASKEV